MTDFRVESGLSAAAAGGLFLKLIQDPNAVQEVKNEVSIQRFADSGTEALAILDLNATAIFEDPVNILGSGYGLFLESHNELDVSKSDIHIGYTDAIFTWHEWITLPVTGDILLLKDVTVSGDLTATSFTIGVNTLTTSEWANLDGQDQTVATTSSPIFVNVTGTTFVIGANSLSTSEWANLDGQDQKVQTISSPTFAALNLTANSNQIVLDSDGVNTQTTLTGSASTSNKIITFPNVTGTLASIANLTQIFAGSMTFNQTIVANATASNVQLNSAGGGRITMVTASTASAFTATFPAVSQTVAGSNVDNVFSANQTISKATPSLIFTDSGGDDWSITVTTGTLAIRDTTDSANMLSGSGANVITLGDSAGATTLVYNVASAKSHVFQVNSASEVTILANSMTFDSGSNDPVLDWTTDGELALTNGLFSLEAGTSATQANVGGVIFDHFADAGNTGTGEDDLYTDTLAANTFGTNGDKVVAQYGGIFVGAALSTQELKVYFGGTLIYDSGALSIGVATNNWTVYVTVIRETSTVVRCDVSLSTDFGTLFPYSTYTRITGLTLTNTQILKITGESAGAGAVDNQIVAKEGYIEWKPAA